MPQGLQVWDSAGKLQLDSGTNTTTVIKVVSIVANQTISYTNTLFSTNNFFFIVTPYGRWVGHYITVSLSGSTITVTARSGLSTTAKVVLGVY